MYEWWLLSALPGCRKGHVYAHCEGPEACRPCPDPSPETLCLRLCPCHLLPISNSCTYLLALIAFQPFLLELFQIKCVLFFKEPQPSLVGREVLGLRVQLPWFSNCFLSLKSGPSTLSSCCLMDEETILFHLLSVMGEGSENKPRGSLSSWADDLD